MPAIGFGAVLFALFQIAVGVYTYRLVERSRPVAIVAAVVMGVGGVVAAVLVGGLLEPIVAEVLILAAYEYWTGRSDVDDAEAPN